MSTRFLVGSTIFLNAPWSVFAAINPSGESPPGTIIGVFLVAIFSIIGMAGTIRASDAVMRLSVILIGVGHMTIGLSVLSDVLLSGDARSLVGVSLIFAAGMSHIALTDASWKQESGE